MAVYTTITPILQMKLAQRWSNLLKSLQRVNSIARSQPQGLQLCFQPQHHVPHPLLHVSSAIFDMWPGLWVLKGYSSCLTSLPAPLPPWAFLPQFFENLCSEEGCPYWWQHPFCLSHPSTQCPLCLSSKALRSASSLYCYTHAFLVTCSLHTPHLIASCYKLFYFIYFYLYFLNIFIGV